MTTEKTDQTEQMTRFFAQLWTAPAAGGPAAMMPMTKAMLESQDQILSETERFMQHWFERRHEAARSAAEAAATLAQDPTDFANASQTIGGWYAHSAERLTKDAQECADVMARCGAHLAAANGGAAEDKPGKKGAGKS